jgi:ABC-type antimicrobial peptide transport system permease subunit
VNGEERAFQAGFGSVMLLLGLFALGLALLGVYSMISILVTQRRREIGVRLALGASRAAILQAVLQRAGATLTLGALLGGALGLAALQLQDKMLAARLPATDPWIVPIVVLVFAGCGAVACWLPALRALRIAPQEALASD